MRTPSKSKSGVKSIKRRDGPFMLASFFPHDKSGVFLRHHRFKKQLCNSFSFNDTSTQKLKDSQIIYEEMLKQYRKIRLSGKNFRLLLLYCTSADVEAFPDHSGEYCSVYSHPQCWYKCYQAVMTLLFGCKLCGERKWVIRSEPVWPPPAEWLLFVVLPLQCTCSCFHLHRRSWNGNGVTMVYAC